MSYTGQLKFPLVNSILNEHEKFSWTCQNYLWRVKVQADNKLVWIIIVKCFVLGVYNEARKKFQILLNWQNSLNDVNKIMIFDLLFVNMSCKEKKYLKIQLLYNNFPTCIIVPTAFEYPWSDEFKFYFCCTYFKPFRDIK